MNRTPYFDQSLARHFDLRRSARARAEATLGWPLAPGSQGAHDQSVALAAEILVRLGVDLTDPHDQDVAFAVIATISQVAGELARMRSDHSAGAYLAAPGFIGEAILNRIEARQ